MSYIVNNTTLGLDGHDVKTIRAYCLGVILIVICIPGFIGNMLVCYVMAAKGFLKANHSSMYNLQFSLLIAESVHLTSIGCYLGPSSLAQSWLFADDWSRKLPTVWLLFGWYSMLVTLCMLGANRYMAVCRPQNYATSFSKRSTVIMIIGSWIFGLFMSILTQYIMPCCAFLLYYGIFSYAYIDQQSANYSNDIILVPLNTITTVFVIVVYSLVLYNVRVTNKKVADSITQESQQRRRIREVRFAFQLLGISSFFVAAWILFNLFAHVIPVSEAESGYLIIVVMLEVINSSADSFVNIIFNKEIKEELKKMFPRCFKPEEGPSTSGLVVKQTTNSNTGGKLNVPVMINVK